MTGGNFVRTEEVPTYIDYSPGLTAAASGNRAEIVAALSAESLAYGEDLFTVSTALKEAYCGYSDNANCLTDIIILPISSQADDST